MGNFSFGSRGEKRPLPDLTPKEQEESRKLYEDYKKKVERGEIKPTSKERKMSGNFASNRDFADTPDSDPEE